MAFMVVHVWDLETSGQTAETNLFFLATRYAYLIFNDPTMLQQYLWVILRKSLVEVVVFVEIGVVIVHGKIFTWKSTNSLALEISF